MRHSHFYGLNSTADDARRELVLDRALDTMLRTLIDNEDEISEAQDQLRALESMLRARVGSIMSESGDLGRKFPKLTAEEREVLADTVGWGRTLADYWDEYLNERAANRY